jgi:hypothetical protein
MYMIPQLLPGEVYFDLPYLKKKVDDHEPTGIPYAIYTSFQRFGVRHPA